MPKYFKKLLLWGGALVAGAALIFGSCSRKTQSDWPSTKKMVRDRFPDVRQISTSDLNRMLQAPDSARPLLLDARSEQEYGVSHLRDARLAASEQEAVGLLKDEPKDRVIIVYCSVGYRSSSLASQLMQKGYTNACNLEGSIFEWANEGNPVYRGDKEVKEVHPFDENWGGLLKKELWSMSPKSSD